MTRYRVDVSTILRRGLLLQCPNCGHPLFARPFVQHRACPGCGLDLLRGDGGFYLGAVALSYGLIVFGWLLPVFVLWLVGVLGAWPAGILAGVGVAVLPVALYMPSRSLWLAIYYAALPHDLPANRRKGQTAGDL